MGAALADLVVTRVRIWTGMTGVGNATGSREDAPVGDTVAVRNGRILAVGPSADLAPLIDSASQVVDLGGRLLLPGLQDSHIHAVRAGLTWNAEMHWEELESLADALAMIRERAAGTSAGRWLRVVGGWHERQFTERRRPTLTELDTVAPAHPVFAQMLYDSAVLNSAGLAACGWTAGCADPPGGTVERDEDGRPTGVVRGMGAFRSALDRMSAPSDEEQATSTAVMLREFAAHGVTAVVDGGGLSMTPESYRPVFALWRRAELPVRLRLFVSAASRGNEVDELTAWMRHGTAGFGDETLRISGLGEVVHLGCHDLEGFGNFAIDDVAQSELLEISRRAAVAGWPMSVHAVLDYSLGRVLDAWEQVAAQHDIRSRRWSIVHADQASPGNIRRMADLGLGVLVQNRMVLQAADYLPIWGADQVARTPPLGDLSAAGIPIAGGSDATRASRYLPWWSIWWLATGGTIAEAGARAPEHCLTVQQALHAYTHAGTWFTFEEASRGRIEPDQAADFFAPTADPFDVPAEQLPKIRSDWTVMAGRTTHTTGAIDGTGTPGKETDR
jgi:predicted amidohydrolase YtcJ